MEKEMPDSSGDDDGSGTEKPNTEETVLAKEPPNIQQVTSSISCDPSLEFEHNGSKSTDALTKNTLPPVPTKDSTTSVDRRRDSDLELSSAPGSNRVSVTDSTELSYPGARPWVTSTIVGRQTWTNYSDPIVQVCRFLEFCWFTLEKADSFFPHISSLISLCIPLARIVPLDEAVVWKLSPNFYSGC
jgi:hypothetical protein